MNACDICKISLFCSSQQEDIQIHEFPESIRKWAACAEDINSSDYLEKVKHFNYSDLLSEIDYYSIRCLQCSKLADRSLCDSCRELKEKEKRSTKAAHDPGQAKLTF